MSKENMNTNETESADEEEIESNPWIYFDNKHHVEKMNNKLDQCPVHLWLFVFLAKVDYLIFTAHDRFWKIVIAQSC